MTDFWTRQTPRESLIFTMAAFDDIKQLAHPYHMLNLMMSLSFLTAKFTPVLCEILFPEGDCGELTMVRFFFPPVWSFSLFCLVLISHFLFGVLFVLVSKGVETCRPMHSDFPLPFFVVFLFFSPGSMFYDYFIVF